MKSTINIMLALFIVLGLTGFEAEAAAADTTQNLTLEQQKKLLNLASEHIEARYVDREEADIVAAQIREFADKGAFGETLSTAEFLSLGRELLFELTNDKHMYFVYHDQPTLTSATQNHEEYNEAAYLNILDNLRANNHIHEVRVLNGNIGYLKLEELSQLPSARTTIDNAMQFLQHTNALILDLRTVGGGSGALAHYVSSYFLKPGTPLLTTIVEGSEHPTVSLSELGGPRYLGRPVYALVSNRTGSAAEDIIFTLKNRERVILVGENSSGAGRGNWFYPLRDGYSISVSTRTVMDAITGEQWESSGIEPHLQSTADDALEQALTHIAAKNSVSQTCVKTNLEDSIYQADVSLADISINGELNFFNDTITSLGSKVTMASLRSEHYPILTFQYVCQRSDDSLIIKGSHPHFGHYYASLVSVSGEFNGYIRAQGVDEKGGIHLYEKN